MHVIFLERFSTFFSQRVSGRTEKKGRGGGELKERFIMAKL
jgi:hypothetical protein